MEELIKAMKIAFASEHSYQLKAQAFHWNVEGHNFPQFHALFQTIYTEVYDNLDAFAENIRKLDAYALGSYTAFLRYSAVQEQNEVTDAQSMLQELLADSEKITKFLKIVFDLSERAGEHGLSDFVAGRMDAHRKHAWMLRSTLKNVGI